MAAEAECRHNDDTHPSSGGAVRYRIPGCTGVGHLVQLWRVDNFSGVLHLCALRSSRQRVGSLIALGQRRPVLVRFRLPPPEAIMRRRLVLRGYLFL